MLILTWLLPFVYLTPHKQMRITALRSHEVAHRLTQLKSVTQFVRYKYSAIRNTSQYQFHSQQLNLTLFSIIGLFGESAEELTKNTNNSANVSNTYTTDASSYILIFIGILVILKIMSTTSKQPSIQPFNAESYTFYFFQ